MTTLVIILIIVAAGRLSCVLLYNGLIRRRNQVENAWAQIDVQLKRRLDLIPNLVETVKAYAAHERRRSMPSSTPATRRWRRRPAQQARRTTADGCAPAAVRAVEAYPDLKANQNFLALQEELTATEGRVAYARQFYNDSVLTYNTKLEPVPDDVLRRMLNFSRREYFEADEAARQAPRLQF